LDPNRPKAIMEPLQGGPMLYAFPGKSEGMYGLINQDGEVVAEPQYDSFHSYGTQYVYSDAEKSRVIGLVAGRRVGMPKTGDGPLYTFTYYSLDGKAKALKCGEAVMIQISPGGRFALVSTKQYDYLPQEQGLFDMEANAWVVKPKDGYWFNIDEYVYSDGAIMRKGTWDNVTEQWYYDYETGERLPLPTDMGILSSYAPEVQWFCFSEGNPYYGDCRWFDRSFNHLPQLDNCRQISRFIGDYAFVYSAYAIGNWVDREGNVIPNEEKMSLEDGSREQGMFCWQTRIPTLLDPDLNPVFTGEPGDRIRSFDGPLKGYVLLDENWQVKASCDAYGKPLPVNEAPYVLRAGYRHLWFKLKDGIWRATPDLSAYRLHFWYYDDGYEGDYLEAKVVEAFEDFILICGWQNRAEKKQEVYVAPTLFAIDWDGNLYPDCPMEPFYDSAKFVESEWIIGHTYQWRTAGEQGPSYFWVEHNGQRGYIDTAGNWLFIDE